MARGEGQMGAALARWCEGFALGSLPAPGAMEALAGLPGGAASLLAAIREGAQIRAIW